MAQWTLIPAASLQAAPWRNGRGVSRDIHTHRGPDGTMLWQVSIADLVADAEFSDYPGYDRIFTPIAGDPPPELAFHGGAFEQCPLLVPRRFPGDVPTVSRIPAPGRAFNVIVARGRFRAEVVVQRLGAGRAVVLHDAPAVLLHCLSGRLTLGGLALEDGDSGLGLGADAEVAGEGVAIAVGIWAVADWR